MIIINIALFALFPDGPADHDISRGLCRPRKKEPVKV